MRSKVPTILAIFVLGAGLVGGIFLMKQIQNFKSGAEATFAPQDLKISNIKDSSITVSWVTDTQTIGFVEYSNSQGTLNQTEPSLLSTTHFFIIQNLSPNTLYSIKVNSGGQSFDNSGSPWQVQTLNSLNPQVGQIISGQILDKNNFPAKNALVYVSPPTGEIFSTVVTPSGNWIIALPALANSTILQILVESSPSVISSAKINLSAANPTPSITLGRSYDFTSQDIQSSSDTPKVPITLP